MILIWTNQDPRSQNSLQSGFMTGIRIGWSLHQPFQLGAPPSGAHLALLRLFGCCSVGQTERAPSIMQNVSVVTAWQPLVRRLHPVSETERERRRSLRNKMRETNSSGKTGWREMICGWICGVESEKSVSFSFTSSLTSFLLFFPESFPSSQTWEHKVFSMKGTSWSIFFIYL